MTASIYREYTYPDLVRRICDLKHLAVPPGEGEKSGNFSSYDRRSVYKEETGRYENWGANQDGDGYLRKEGGSIVALELDGPGVLWRFWSADPKEGDIRIYIDSEDEPVLQKPFRDFFETFGDERCPANFPNLLPTLSRGRNCFIPIPFQRYCKIVLDEGWGNFYHITYTRMPPETKVPSFTGTFDRPTSIALAEVDRILQLRGKSPYSEKSEDTFVVKKNVNVPPKSKVNIVDYAGSGAIRMITAAVTGIKKEETDDQRCMLRELTLSIKWDHEQHPSVWSPLGDFFGSAPGINDFRSLPLSMDYNGFRSYWYMPFSSGALLELENAGEQMVEITMEIELEKLPAKDADSLMRFHAKWHRGNFLNSETSRFMENGDRWPDWPLLLLKGRGRFCGIHLHVYNAWKIPGEKPETWWYGRWDRKTIDWWWGEGDEKFFVDGEKFPSTFGTGSEDYIGYAWAAEPPFPMFDSGFACQSFIEIDANGHTSVNRFQIADNVPFLQSFEGFIEKYKNDIWEQENKCLYAVTAYWYQMPGQTDPYESVPMAERYGFYHLK